MMGLKSSQCIKVETQQELDDAAQVFEERVNNFKKRNLELEVMPIMREEEVVMIYMMGLEKAMSGQLMTGHSISKIEWMTQYGPLKFKVVKFTYNPYI
jgi:hypothetical protein